METKVIRDLRATRVTKAELEFKEIRVTRVLRVTKAIRE